VPEQPRAGQDVIRPITDPMYREGHLAILKGNLSPEGCVAKVTGLVKKESLAKLVADVSGMERGFNEVKIQHFKPTVAAKELAASRH